jgi:Ran GTPase-activating protein (RanGAP) involved in mRNA processing and transport
MSFAPPPTPWDGERFMTDNEGEQDCSDEVFSDTRWLSLAQEIKMDTSNNLTSLCVRNCGLGQAPDGLPALCRALLACSSVRVLDVSSNDLLVEGAKQLAHVIRDNYSISRLNMESNNITAFGANAIADALKDK